ncbi:MAG: sodium/solute symporter [Bacteroidota bacterium]
MNSTISTIDIAVIVGYFVVVVFIGLYVSKKTRTEEDLFLGGRSLTWGFIGLSLFASNISTSTIIGLSGAAYTSGIVQSVYEWMTGIPLIIAAFIFIPIYLRTRITTIPEFLLYRYDRRSQLFFSVVTIIASILVETAGGLYAGAIVLKTFFPDLLIWQVTLFLAGFAGLYTIFGGLKAVVYTDALQAIILIVGCGVMSWYMFARFDFDWGQVVAATREGHLSVVRPIDDPSLPWPGLLLGVQLLGFWYWTTNQYIVQRILGAKDVRHARWGALLAGFLKLIPLFIMVLPGVMAISLFPNLVDGDMVFPTMVTEVLPIGLVGLVLAGLISAVMSSIDSTLNSASTLVVVDFIKPLRKEATQSQLIGYGRITTVVLMIIAAVWAPMIALFGGIWFYLQQMYSIFVPPVVVLFLVGVFYKKGNAEGAFWTLLIGVAVGITFFVLSLSDIWKIHFTITVGFVIAISAIVFVLVSHLRKSQSHLDSSKFIFRKEDLYMGNEGLSWYQDYRYQSMFLLILIAALLIAFW